MTYFSNPWDDIDPCEDDGEARAELAALLIEQGEKPRYAAYLAETLTDDEVQAWLAPPRRSQAEMAAICEAMYAAEIDNDIPF
jgi:hypothetical protein